jgi:DNA-binding transcriptional regulator YhcF (GntR family)
LSAEFGVNPNTIARTYERLTLDGTVRSARGVGFFVAEEAKSAIIKQRKEEFYNEQMPAFIQQMQLLGITPDEIQEQYNKFLSNEDK